MSHNNLKKANEFVLQGNIESAFPILLKDFEKKEAFAAAALAQIAAFQGRWEDVIHYGELIEDGYHEYALHLEWRDFNQSSYGI